MTVFVHDDYWSRRPLPQQVVELIQGCKLWVSIKPVCTLQIVVDLARKLPPDEHIVALGGGGVLDAVKLACAAQHVPLSQYAQQGRSGMMVIPRTPPSKICAIPSTIGTGTEANDKAVLEVSPKRRRLVLGEGLLPESCRYVPQLYVTLPKTLVIHGAVEIFLRVAGMFMAYQHSDARYELSTLLIRAAEFGQKVASTPNPGADEELMYAGARLSSRTHQVDLVQEQTLFAWPLWYLANELCAIAGVTKLQATLALVPSVMNRIGDFGFGSKERLDEIENIIGSSVTDFIAGVQSNLTPAVQSPLSNIHPDQVAKQAFSQWAGPNFALHGATLRQLQEIYREACKLL